MCVSHSVTGPSETCFFQSFKTENIAYTTPCTPHHCADTHHLHHTPPTRSQLHHPPTCELFLLQLTVREVECRLGLHEASECQKRTSDNVSDSGLNNDAQEARKQISIHQSPHSAVRWRIHRAFGQRCGLRRCDSGPRCGARAS